MNDQEKSALKRTLIGKVVSDKMDKTASVLVERRMKHPIYGKVVRRTKKYLVHDANNQARIGDTVEIQEGRPISKNKSWVLTKVIQVAQII
ncbi:30S ribosomal protein S17 [Oxalobacter aliiformigenes]|uniref:30S ribosomal protein S17 n=1 Tax=Oxalobacter aliiformigenes TaxID=2946593 RepID=UPI0022B04189|nr:30S ribosomal protein S17 [Oxalobacter aliiformigenes]WAV89246.1 30S ribosomal protein S17 [Oxalobacter aliiformigenes]